MTGDKKNGIKTLIDMSLRNWSALFCFEMFYRGFGFCALFPFLRYLLSLLPGLAGETILSQSNILLIFQYPLALLLFLVILLLTGLFVYFEIVALFLSCEMGWKRQRVTVWGLWKQTSIKVASFLHPKRMSVFLLLPVMMLSVFALLSGYLQNIRIPEFVMEFIESKPGLFESFIGLLLVFHLILFFYLFGFPSLLFDNKSFIDSWRESAWLLKKSKLRTALRLGIYTLLLYLSLTILAAVGILLLAGSVWIFSGSVSGRSQFQAYCLSLQSIWGILSNILVSIFLCSFIILLYHQRKCESRPAQQKRIWSIRQIAVRSVTMLGTVAFLLLFSESEISGKTWFPQNISTKIIAHRAGATFAPENTLAALRQAIEDHAYMAEIDIQQLKDGTLIAMHDANFKRTTGVDLNVWNADYESIRRFDAGSSFSSGFIGEPVPTLEDMLQAANGKIHLMLELKASGQEQSLVENTLELIKKYGMQDQCMIASMDLELLKQVKKLEPDMQTVYISMLLLSKQFDLKELDAYSIETTSLTAMMVTQAHLQNKEVYVWTANSEVNMRKILRCEADGLITDNPKLADYCIKTANENTFVDALTNFFFPVSAENQKVSSSFLRIKSNLFIRKLLDS